MPPPPPPSKRQKRPAIVLDEEEYSQAVSDIIARDFFPGLHETQAQAEYMEALDSNNPEWIRTAGRNLTQAMTPGPRSRSRTARNTSFAPGMRSTTGTPSSIRGTTQAGTPLQSEDSGSRVRADINMSLGAFQAKYTSEDNESFNALLDKQNERRAEKYAFFHAGNKIPTSRQIAYREQQQKLLGEGDSRSQALISRSENTGRSTATVARPSQDLDARPASLDGFPNSQGSRNHFMFGPDGVGDLTLLHDRTEGNSETAPPKSVSYTNTRFPTPGAASEPPVPASPSISAIDAAIAGRPNPTASEPGYTGAETPRVNGYAFVDAEPTQSELGIPVTDEAADAAEREAALQLMPKVDKSGPNPFTIAESSERENVHRRLVEKADAGRRRGDRLDQLRNLGITPGRTPTPKFASGPSIRKGASMTPAALRLARSISTPRQESNTFGQKQDWTPTPRTKR